MNPNGGLSRNLIITFLFFAFILVVIIGLLSRRTNDIPIADEYINLEGPVIMNNSTKLFTTINNGETFTRITEDIGVFARSTFSDTQPLFKQGFVFVVDENSIVDDSKKVTFSGVIRGSADVISVQFDRLNYGKIKISIKNNTTGATADDKLPSNSARNQFIGGLPKNTKSYSLQYLEDTGGYYIVLSGNQQKALQEVRAELLKNLGVPDLSSVDVSIIGTTDDGNIESIPNPDSDDGNAN